MIPILSTDSLRLEYIIKLSKALIACASELLEHHKQLWNLIVPKLEKGLALLPDEVIGLIFRFFAHPEMIGISDL